jgi:uncharacterized protein (DUF1499 family)
MTQTQETPAMVNWIGYIAIALLLILPLSVLTVRAGAWQQGLLMYALSCLGCLLLFALSGLLLALPRFVPFRRPILLRPLFVTAPEQRGDGTNPLDIKPDSIEAQQQAYPDVQTIRTALSIEAAFDKALAVAAELGWEVYHQDLNAGVIEAVDTTAIMGFKDDVVIRLRTNAEGTLLDLRSVSRVGIGDIGANAKRIRNFRQAFGA